MNLTPGFTKIVESAKQAGVSVEPWGDGAVIVGARRDRRTRDNRVVGGVILWPTGWAQDASVDASSARMIRNVADVRAMVGL